MSSGIRREEGRASGLGLEAWEIRESGRTIMATVVVTGFAGAFAGIAVGAHWVLLAYVAGAAVALGALRMDRGADTGGRLRRVLARTCEWELRIFLFAAMTVAAVKVFSAIFIGPVLVPLMGLWDPEVTKTEMAAAVEAAARGAVARAEPWTLAIGISGVAVGLLSGLADWLWLGAVGERLGVRPWRVLFGRGARQDMREARRRERGRLRRLLRGES